MTTRDPSDPPSPFSFRLGRRTALFILTVLGLTLASVVLFDVYQDWALEGKPLWSTLLENALPLLLATSLPLAAWQLSRTEQGSAYLPSATKWAVAGCLMTLVVAGLVLGFQLLQGRIKPRIFVTQMLTAGALAGFLAGCGLVEVYRSRTDASRTDSDPGVHTPLRHIQLSRAVSLFVVYATGAVLTSIILFDVYQDWVPQDNPLWSTLVENAVPLLLALAIPLFGWRLSQIDRGERYLSEAAKWTLAGCGACSWSRASSSASRSTRAS